MLHGGGEKENFRLYIRRTVRHVRPFWRTRAKLRQCTYRAALEIRSSLCGNNPHVPHVRTHVHPIRAGKRQTCAAHVHRLARVKMHVQETCAARNKRDRKRIGPPDSEPVGRWQDDPRRILDSRGQAALLRVRPGAFLFDLARLYTPAQRLDQPHHPQPGFCFCTCAGWVREGR